LLPCTEGTDQTDDDSTGPNADTYFGSRDHPGNGYTETPSGEKNGAGVQEERHTVILTGCRGVGKSSIVASFLRSDRTSMKDSFASDSSPFGIYVQSIKFIISVAHCRLDFTYMVYYTVFRKK